METKTVQAPNISCGHCVRRIETELGELPGVRSVKATHDSKQITVSWEAPASWDQIKAALVEMGYPPQG